MEYIKYIPAWGGNRDKKNPFTVEIHPLTRGEIKAYAKMIRQTQIKGFRNEFKDNSADIQEKQFISNVGKIEGFSHYLIKVPVTSAEELYDAPGCTTLVSEIIDVMEDVSNLKENEIKNSAPQSAGASGPRTSGGIVPDAS